jgi:hypothetical protein
VYEADVIRGTGVGMADVRLPGDVDVVLVLCRFIGLIRMQTTVGSNTQALQMSGGRDCGQTGWQRQLSYRIEMAGPRAQTDSGGDAAKEAH